jgi:hypothetical protein
MMPIPPPLKYRSKTLNEMMRRVNPQNIDDVADELRKIDTPDQPLVVRLSISVNLEALRVRRDQYVRCGVIEANAIGLATQPAQKNPENHK